MSVIKKLSTYIAAGQAGLVITSEEPEECLQELATTARASRATDEPWDLMFWDAADGLTDAHENVSTATRWTKARQRTACNESSVSVTGTGTCYRMAHQVPLMLFC